MSTPNTVVDEKYNEAIQSLKKINNLLFYEELKSLLKEREQTIAQLNEEVYESVEKMQHSMKQVPIHISEQLREEIITRQSELFDSEMMHFHEKIILLEKKISQWHQQYQEYITKTEKLLTDLRELQRNDYKFIDLQTEKVLEAIRTSQEEIHGLFARELNEQASVTNVKYESVGERLSFIINNITSIEGNLLTEAEEWKIQQQQAQKDLLVKWNEKWDEKWKQHHDTTAKKERNLKKWLIGLAVGQGISILLVVVFFILR
ncbi:hypothetical protein [Neobacillus kokaensis]|uniref:Uncharacterized protein n=1 Tax=Neobacillus kokaensis TaxID=2759023 RepID=A0ABQ3N9B1_9BACI|nr:hypothetical protein [Neobacillus kokaensis]GHI00970.1 hypothetical protein AM1BK_45120 [Neobacillus kokaensis]